MKFKFLGVLVAVAVLGLSVGDALTGHGIKGNKNLNPMVVGDGSSGSSGSGSGSSGSGSSSGNSSSSSGEKSGDYVLIDECKWTVTVFDVDVNGKKVVVKRINKKCTKCAYTCNFKEDGNCKEPKLCPADAECDDCE
jgi:hypothetical protein